MKGRIFLYHRSGTMARSENYMCRSEREQVLNKWRKLYGKAFDDCYLHVLPEANGLIDEGTGMNKWKQKQKLFRKLNQQT